MHAMKSFMHRRDKRLSLCIRNTTASEPRSAIISHQPTTNNKPWSPHLLSPDHFEPPSRCPNNNIASSSIDAPRTAPVHQQP
eukprot:scaffold1296_cov74-Cyclotella_meneghiniana.AAC.4